MASLSTLRGLRPTRRGLGVLAVAGLAFALGATAGARSLNAVVVPALVGLLAGGVQVVRADPPSVERSRPAPGFAGETCRVEVAVDADVPCTMTETVADGLSTGQDAAGPPAAVGHGGRFTYDVELEHRGEHRLGPATCRLTDSLGLFARTVETNGSTTQLVYPDVYALEGTELSGLVRRVFGDDRTSFDRLREFVPGDSMRDIHWRASARRPADEFVVAEYGSRSAATHVDLVGESTTGDADAMAATLASVAVHLLEAGVTVAVTVPAGRRVAHPGEAASLLRLLALTEGGRVDDDVLARAEVVVTGEGDRATVSLGDRDLDGEGLFGDHRGREVLA